MSTENKWPTEGNTGHIWDDDIRELDNPPPLWWMLALYAGFIMILFYAVYYPTIPMTDGATKGAAGWTAYGEYKDDFEVLNKYREARFAEQESQLDTLSVAEILENQDLTSYAMATSKMLFGDYCAACHGAGGMGNVNFPILADDDWLWGGDASAIHQTIANGRKGNMPAFGHLPDEQVTQLVDYIYALQEGNVDPAMPGATLYLTNGCVGCHGAVVNGAAQANQFTGAANLSDGIARYNISKEGLEYTIRHGVNAVNDTQTREGEMPAFGARLSDKDVKRLAVYVHQLGGGQ